MQHGVLCTLGYVTANCMSRTISVSFFLWHFACQEPLLQCASRCFLSIDVKRIVEHQCT